jgi:hypothetical protein
MAPYRSLAATIQRIDGPWRGFDDSVRGVGAYLGMSLPISVLDLMDRLDALPTSRDWNVNVVFGGGFALGGNVGLTIQSNGSWRFHGSFHDSGLDPYSFRVTGTLRAPDDKVLMAFVHGGDVGGTVGGGSRDHSWDEPGLDYPRRLFVQTNWPFLADATLTVTAQASDEGIGGGVVSVLEGLAAFVLAVIALGPAVGVTLLVGAIVGETLNAAGGPGELVGLLVIGGGMFLMANGIFLPVLPLGLATWALTDEIVRHRTLTSAEEAFANQVFQGTLPSRDRLVLTNLAAVTGRAFTWPNVDGSILLNMVNNSAYDDPVHFKKSPGDPEGRLFIHELTHAWQMAHTPFMPMTICDGITGHLITEPIDGKSAYYNPGVPGLPWGDYNMEQQAVIVHMWFNGQVEYRDKDNNGGPVVFKQMDPLNPWFRYIVENIWAGQI